ncbi:uncharacterized protein V1518DRAFT_411624 [Limtongia smithiae]|uniref:uncharacterized protein n=1 Tax=Limtongia smithiae TaxID=1125753 RepID=UPI0034CDF531
MVGVSGGSRGCDVCRLRKIKCDETFPQCLRCVKSKRECPGPREVVVPARKTASPQPDGEPQRKRRRRRLVIEGLRPVVVAQTESRLGTFDFLACRTVQQQQPAGRTLQMRAPPRLPPLSSQQFAPLSFLSSGPLNIPRDLSPYPEYDLYQYCVGVFFNWVAVAAHPFRFKGDDGFAIWASNVPRFVLSPSTSVTTCASRALILSHCGMILRNMDIDLVAANWFVEALRQQKQLIGQICAIDDISEKDLSGEDPTATLLKLAHMDTGSPELPSSCTRLLPPTTATSMDSAIPLQSFRNMRGNEMSVQDDTLYGAFLLSVYEVFRSSSGSSWLNLLSGAGTLMRCRGAEAYSNDFGFSLFHGMRPLLTMHALMTRKPSFLNEPEWKTIPYSRKIKSVSSKLLDLVLELPTYSERIEELFNDAFEPREVMETTGVVTIEDEWSHLESLKEEYRTEEVWAELRKISEDLDAMNLRMDAWLLAYSEDAKEYARNLFALSADTEFDPDTAAVVRGESQCTVVRDRDEWRLTHFFKPSLQFVTKQDTQTIGLFYSSREIVSFLQYICAPSLFLDLQEYVRDPTIVQRDSATVAYRAARRADITTAGNRCAKQFSSNSCQFATRVAKAPTYGSLFPMGPARPTFTDPHERGWIWHQIEKQQWPREGSIMDLNIPGLSLPQIWKEYTAFQDLPVCPGCGEHVRPDSPWI